MQTCSGMRPTQSAMHGIWGTKLAQDMRQCHGLGAPSPHPACLQNRAWCFWLWLLLGKARQVIAGSGKRDCKQLESAAAAWGCSTLVGAAPLVAAEGVERLHHATLSYRLGQSKTPHNMNSRTCKSATMACCCLPAESGCQGFPFAEPACRPDTERLCKYKVLKTSKNLLQAIDPCRGRSDGATAFWRAQKGAGTIF